MSGYDYAQYDLFMTVHVIIPVKLKYQKHHTFPGLTMFKFESVLLWVKTLSWYNVFENLALSFCVILL